jgi:hypothetical protein
LAGSSLQVSCASGLLQADHSTVGGNQARRPGERRVPGLDVLTNNVGGMREVRNLVQAVGSL